MSSGTDFLQATVTGPDWINNQGLQRIVNEELRKALDSSMAKGKKTLKAEIIRSKATASRTLLNSVIDLVNETAIDSWVLSGDIYFRSPADNYAGNADKGRRPGRVPPSAEILSWMKIKRIDEKYLWPIMMSLAKKGTETQFWNLWDRTPFLDSATAKIDADVKDEFEQASERIRLKLEHANITSIKS